MRHLDDTDRLCCRYHPNVVIGSPCGLIEGLCGECEYGAELDAAKATGGPVVAPAPQEDDGLPF